MKKTFLIIALSMMGGYTLFSQTNTKLKMKTDVLTNDPSVEQGSVGAKKPTIVLVHGGFVDGSGWQAVYENLKKDGYNVAIVQNPTITLAGDVAATKQVIANIDGPVTLVGHSYGGGVKTEAGKCR